MKKVKFTKHAYEKFSFLKRYSFEVYEKVVRQAVGHPTRVDRRGDQMLALKPIDEEHAIRVVYEEVNNNIVMISFYP